jgi:hypothetical protein
MLLASKYDAALASLSSSTIAEGLRELGWLLLVVVKAMAPIVETDLVKCCCLAMLVVQWLLRLSLHTEPHATLLATACAGLSFGDAHS